MKQIMKNLMQWVLAATLICGTSVFTSCSSDNDDKAADGTEGRRHRRHQHLLP